MWLISACGEGDPDTGELATDEPPPAEVLLADSNNYHFEGTLDVPSTPVKATTDLALDWAALTEDLQCHPVDPVADIDNLALVFAGAFSGTPAAGLQETVLVKSSANSQLVEPMLAQMSGEEILKNFKPSGTEYALAIRLAGKFKTAFPDGQPKAPDAKPDEKKPEEKKDAPTAAGLKESATENAVILVGDSDFIQDPIAVTEMANPFGGQRMVSPRNGNLALAQSAVEQLSGDSNLISVRSRASRERPFTEVKKREAAANERYQAKINELQTGLTEAQTKLNELQRSKTPEAGQRFILSPEQQAEIANFKKKETEVKQQLKTERKKLRADIDSLENRIKWINIAAMPALVAVAGMFLAVARRRRQAAH